MLPLLPIFLHVHVCLFFSSPRTANPFPFHHNYIQNIFKSSFFQLTRICLLYSITFQHFLVKVILINNLVDQTTDKFTNLISIFKTHRKSMQCHVSKHLEINSAWVNRLSIVTKPRSCICKSFLLSIILFYKISCNCFYSIAWAIQFPDISLWSLLKAQHKSRNF